MKIVVIIGAALAHRLCGAGTDVTVFEGAQVLDRPLSNAQAALVAPFRADRFHSG